MIELEIENQRLVKLLRKKKEQLNESTFLNLWRISNFKLFQAKAFFLFLNEFLIEEEGEPIKTKADH